MHTCITRACVTAGSVTASSPDARQGGYVVLALLVPNESAKATTTGLTVTKDPATSAPTAVTWTAAQGTSIGDSQFGQFQLSVGTLPKQATLNLPATQTYSDGSVVKWDEPAKPDGPEAALRGRGGAALRARGRS